MTGTLQLLVGRRSLSRRRTSSAAGRAEWHGDDEFYASELEGCEVIMKEDGKHVGVVIDIYRGRGA